MNNKSKKRYYVVGIDPYDEGIRNMSRGVLIGSEKNIKMSPGINESVFTLQFDHPYLNDILSVMDGVIGPNGVEYRVTKVYKYTLWRRLLNWLKMPVKRYEIRKIDQWLDQEFFGSIDIKNPISSTTLKCHKD